MVLEVSQTLAQLVIFLSSTTMEELELEFQSLVMPLQEILVLVENEEMDLVLLDFII